MRVLTYTELKEKKGIRYVREHIRRREKAGTFPQHIELGEARVGWLEEEIDQWIAGLAAKRNPNPEHA
jgi:prophage regulatory protein